MRRRRSVPHMVLLRAEWHGRLTNELLASCGAFCHCRFGTNPDSASVCLATSAECHANEVKVCASGYAHRIYKYDFVAALNFLMEATASCDLTRCLVGIVFIQH